MTTTTEEQTLVLFDGDNSHCYLDLDTCRDICTYGMAQGVLGFIYNSNLREWFNENSDEIEDYLNDYIDGVYGSSEYKNYIHYLASQHDTCDHLQLKQQAVWMYVECKCFDWLSIHDDEF